MDGVVSEDRQKAFVGLVAASLRFFKEQPYYRPQYGRQLVYEYVAFLLTLFTSAQLYQWLEQYALGNVPELPSLLDQLQYAGEHRYRWPLRVALNGLVRVFLGGSFKDGALEAALYQGFKDPEQVWDALYGESEMDHTHAAIQQRAWFASMPFSAHGATHPFILHG